MGAVLLGVVAARLGVMVSGVRGMAVRCVSVMRGLLVVTTLVMLGSLAVVLSGLFVMLGRFVVVLRSLMRHGSALLFTACMLCRCTYCEG